MKRIALLLCPVLLCGCTVGSKAIRSSYTSYNQTIAYNQNQQMLLNLVRLKYRETPLFLKVGALSTSYDFTASADLGTGEEVVIARGPIGPALLASAALPGIFPPVPFHGQTLVDGAVVNLVPISHALAGPVERVFVLDVSDPIGERPIRSPLDVAVRAFAISRDQRFELELQWVPKEIEVVVLPPPVDERDFFDFSGGDRLIADAYELTMGALDELREHPGHQRRRRWWRRLAS